MPVQVVIVVFFTAVFESPVRTLNRMTKMVSPSKYSARNTSVALSMAHLKVWYSKMLSELRALRAKRRGDLGSGPYIRARFFLTFTHQ